MSSPAPTRRFSGRVADYVRYRPGSPEALLEALVEEAGLGPAEESLGKSALAVLRKGPRLEEGLREALQEIH